MRPILIILISLVVGPAASAMDDGLNRFNPISSVLGLSSSPRIDVVRDASTLSLVHEERVIMEVTARGFRLTDEGVPNHGQDQQTYVEVVRDPATGQRLYTRGITGRGARLLVIEKGQINKEGLHVLSFDNDDVHISDGSGRLIYSRQTDGNGTLVERAAVCGCTRVTNAQGIQHVWPSLHELGPVH